MTFTTYRINRDGVDRLLFLMHGYTAEQHHLASYVPLVDPDERFTAIAPRGPLTMPDGDGAGWWDIDLESGNFEQSWEQFGPVVADLEAFIATEAEAAGVPLERCVVGGFSQGGWLALALAGKPDAPNYAAVWAICCGLPEEAGIAADLGNGNGRPALFQWGNKDGFVGPDRPKDVIAALKAGGWDLRDHEYDMAHSQTIEMMVDAREWLAGLL